MKKLILFLILIIGSLPLLSQSILRGVVLDSDGQPLSFASISYEKDSLISGVSSDLDGLYSVQLEPGTYIVTFSSLGYETKQVEDVVVKPNSVIKLDIVLSVDEMAIEEVTVMVAKFQAPLIEKDGADGQTFSTGSSRRRTRQSRRYRRRRKAHPTVTTQETYGKIAENHFLKVVEKPLSTFSIDVDHAAYSNVRRYLNTGQKPPVDAVKIEEMVNYFSYDYPEPTGKDPFEIYTEIAQAPWDVKHQLLHIGIQGRKIPVAQLPASNIVFLIDVSGSMMDLNKLPLLKSAFKLLVKKFRKKDRVAIVVYAGSAGLALPSTAGDKKQEIIAALDALQSGGSTAGGAGIQLAYKIAKENFIKEGNNRVILATDGDFNVGMSSDSDMETLITNERKSGVFLTCLGFGMGNYKDSKLETLADKGNGNHAYIDNMQEAKKTLISEFGGTLFTIAKDVKIQIEFNPNLVQSYRLIGYENRLLEDKDFNDDTKDAGELGAGHTVTALYEIIPVGVESEFAENIDPLKYQNKTHQKSKKRHAHFADELATVKFRYKKPTGRRSKKIVHTIKNEQKDFAQASDSFRFSASVAYFGMILRESKFIKDPSLDLVVSLAASAKGIDAEGYRSEFVRLVNTLK